MPCSFFQLFRSRGAQRLNGTQRTDRDAARDALDDGYGRRDGGCLLGADRFARFLAEILELFLDFLDVLVREFWHDDLPFVQAAKNACRGLFYFGVYHTMKA